MKKIFLFWILSVLNMIAIGQGTEYFNKILQSFPGSSSISTVVSSDSNYFLVMDNVLPSHPQTTFYLLVDKDGSIIDSAHLSDTFKISAVFPGNSAIRTSSDKFVVCTNRTGTNYHDYGYLVCLNLNLDTLWTRTFTHPDTAAISQPNADVFNIITAIRQTWDGGFIITGNYTKNCIQGNVRSYLLKTDSMGVMEWIKKYDSVGKVYDVQITQDSGYIFSNLLVGFTITKTNPMGEILWQLKPNNDAHLASSAIALTSDNCVIYASPHQYNMVQGVPQFGIDVCKVRLSDQAIIWNKKHNLYHSFECHSLHQTFTIQILPNDYIAIGGTSKLVHPTATNPHKGVMMKLTPNGDSVWARYYSYGAFTDFGQFERMILTDDGGFLAVGYYYPFPPPAGTGSRPWIVKMDSLGCDTPGCHLISIEERVLSMKELEMFPNPFSDIMHVVLPEGYSGGKLVMYDVQGKKAMETEVPANWGQQNFAVETNLMNPGIYLIELTDRDGRVWRGKAVRK
jgi:hypothetical protein